MFTPQILRPVTSADVARVAGVSRATVSFVLNDNPSARVSPATRKRVLDAAASLGYRPDVRARALRAGQTSEVIIPLCFADMYGELAPLLPALVDSSADRGLDAQVLLTCTSGPQVVSQWALRRPKGVIALARDCDAAGTEVLRSAGVQGLIVLSDQPIDYAPYLALEQRPLAQAAVDYVVGRGARSIAYLRPAGSEAGAGRREDALRQGAAASGMDFQVVRGGYEPATLRDWASAWRYDPHPPSAVVCHDDALAFCAIHALHAVGVRVPDDVMVVGQGNYPLAASYVPALTTVWRDLESVAEQLASALLGLFAGEMVAQLLAPPVQIAVRESA